MNESFAETLRVQFQVWNAVTRREIHARYARTALGFMTGIMEPAALIIMFYYLRFLFGAGEARSGIPVSIILATGYVAHYAMRGGALEVAEVSKVSSRLLMFPRIFTTDAIVGRTVMNWFAYTYVMLVIFVGAIVFTAAKPPDNIAEVLFGFCTSIWAGAAIGVILGVIERYFPGMHYFVPVFLRGIGYVSGNAYMAGEIPRQFLPYLSWNPLLHMTEFMREGWASSYVSPAADATYVMTFLVIITGFALLLERLTRHFHLS